VNFGFEVALVLFEALFFVELELAVALNWGQLSEYQVDCLEYPLKGSDRQ
jgi:hypothetical protein